MSLEVKNISHYYDKKKYILNNVSFSVNPGEKVGLLAPSGYGKSTLGKIICSYLKAKKGEVLLDGINVRKIKGYNPIQMIHQHPEKSVNPRWKIKKTLNEGFEVDTSLIKSLEIEEEFLEKYPNELSGGQLQRICIARALCKDTRYLVADEITTMLDAFSQMKLLKMLLDISSKRNTGIIFISHNKILIEKISDRIIKLDEINHI